VSWKPKTKHGRYKLAPGFDNGMQRFAQQASSAPAPGAYDPKDVNKAMKPLVVPTSGFGTSEERLKKGTKYTPGPGAYAVGAAWDKRSFNVTLDNTVLF